MAWAMAWLMERFSFWGAGMMGLGVSFKVCSSRLRGLMVERFLMSSLVGVNSVVFLNGFWTQLVVRIVASRSAVVFLIGDIV